MYLRNCATVLELKKNAVLFREGSKGKDIYILLKGGVRLTVNGKHLTYILEENSFIGEMSILIDKPRSATVTTIFDSSFVVIKEKDFKDLFIKLCPKLGYSLLRSMAKRLFKTTHDLMKKDKFIRKDAQSSGIYSDIKKSDLSVPNTFDKYVHSMSPFKLLDILKEVFKNQLIRTKSNDLPQFSMQYNFFVREATYIEESKQVHYQDIFHLARNYNVEKEFTKELRERFKYKQDKLERIADTYSS